MSEPDSSLDTPSVTRMIPFATLNNKRSRSPSPDVANDSRQVKERGRRLFTMSGLPDAVSAAPVSPTFVCRRLAHARAQRATNTQHVATLKLKIEEVKIELSMLLEELREAEFRKAEVDRLVGGIKHYMDEHSIVEQSLSEES